MGKSPFTKQLKACAEGAKKYTLAKVLEAVESISADLEEMALEIEALRSGKAEADHTHEIFSIGTTAPTNTKLLWIDTASGVTKYFNGSEWKPLPVAWG